MSKKIVLLIILLNASFYVFSRNSQNGYTLPPEKNIFTGVVLGSLGLSGLYIPGTYGWGNFYARDYRGFILLNGIGSMCTICTYIEAMRYANDPVSYLVTGISPLAFIGIFGSIFCGAASTVWGGFAVREYNDVGRYNIKSVSLIVLPGIEKVSIGLKIKL